MRRRSLVYVAAWLAATSFGVAISWAGVRGVLYTAAVSPPPAVSVPGGAAGATPSPTKEPVTASPSGTPSRTTATTQPSKLTPTSSAPAPSDSGDVRSFTVRGGHVALALFPHRIKLISATPEAGWEASVFDEPGADWLRVDFRRGRDHSGIIGTWNDGEPRVQEIGH